MATFLMFGKYSSEAVKGVSAKRTKEAVNLIKKFGKWDYQKMPIP